MINIIFTIFLFFTELYAEETCPLKLCNETLPSKESFVERLCNASDSHMNGRCCTANNTLIGLDLRSCEIKQLHITEYNFTELIIMDLTENNIQKLTTDDLTGLIHLVKLYLPLDVPCPGGQKAWNETTFDPSLNITRCSIQINPCQDLEINCTANGECMHTGPGSAKCVCKPGYHGYKCLNQGEFPTTIFFSSIAATTVVLCILLWFGLGRDIYKTI